MSTAELRVSGAVPAPQGVLIVGGGVMGVGIAHAFLLAGWPVALIEANMTLAKQARSRIEQVLHGGVERGKVDAEVAGAAMGRLRVGSEIVTAGPVDIAIEAVSERLDLKREVLALMERVNPSVLATNTGALSITELAEELERPSAFAGMHFFNPVWARPLVEVVAGPRTAKDTVDRLMDVARLLGKQPIAVRDAPGFASSRLGIALGLEAMRMVEEGITRVPDIDRAMALGYGHPIGPLELTDRVGLDIRLDVARHLAEVIGPRYEPPPILERLVAEGSLGQKTGHGFYDWDGDKPHWSEF